MTRVVPQPDIGSEATKRIVNVWAQPATFIPPNPDESASLDRCKIQGYFCVAPFAAASAASSASCFFRYAAYAFASTA